MTINMKREFTNKTEKELHTMVAEKRLALRNFRFSIAGSNTRNVKEGSALKKDIARINTILNAQDKTAK